MNVKEWRTKQREGGYCTYCKNRTIKGKSYCLIHYEKNLERARKTKNKQGKKAIRERRLKLYQKRVKGGICTNCGVELDREFEPYTKCFNCLELAHKGR